MPAHIHQPRRAFAAAAVLGLGFAALPVLAAPLAHATGKYNLSAGIGDGRSELSFVADSAVDKGYDNFWIAGSALSSDRSMYGAGANTVTFFPSGNEWYISADTQTYMGGQSTDVNRAKNDAQWSWQARVRLNGELAPLGLPIP